MLQDIKERKFNIGEIFRYAGEIYRSNILFMIAIAVGVYLPFYIIVMLLPVPASLQVQNALTVNEYLDKMLPYLGYLYSINAVSVLFTPLAAAAVTFVARESIENRSATLPGIMDASLMKWGKLIITALIYVLIVSLGGFLIIPGIYFSVLCTFYPNVIATKDVYGVKALLHSKRIVRGRWWRAFGVIALISVMTYFISSGVDAVFILLGINAGPIMSVLVSVVIEIISMYFQIALALWYLNHHFLLEMKERPN